MTVNLFLSLKQDLDNRYNNKKLSVIEKSLHRKQYTMAVFLDVDGHLKNIEIKTCDTLNLYHCCCPNMKLLIWEIIRPSSQPSSDTVVDIVI